MIRLFCCLLLLPGFAFSQVEDSLKQVRFFEVGLGFSIMQHEVDFTPSATVEPFPGSSFGLHLRYFDNPLVGLQAELNYVTAGWKEELDPDFTSLYERQTNYLELQILTQFSLGRGAIQPLLQAGPYLSLPLSETEDIPEEYVSPGDPTVAPYYGLALPFRINYGLQIGGGLNVHVGPFTLQLEGRYLLGFNDLIKTGTTVASISRRKGVGGRIGLFSRLHTQSE